MKIALLGAEGTGKTRLGADMARHLEAMGQTVGVVPEVLREWCHREGRTPSRAEQSSIATEQARRVITMTACDVVITDTAPLMTAIYSDWLFEDRTIYAFALQHHEIYDLTLVMGLDLPWVADAHQRDGPQSQRPVDALLRSTLALAAIPYSMVYGLGPDRCQHALAAVFPGKHKAPIAPPDPNPVRLYSVMSQHQCDRCSDAVCEKHLFRSLVARELLERSGAG
ncbi:MAG: hypothetical protein RL211_581 [Pseudomonadota bacterium]|jgi:nicotinamide riboside kinase